MSRGFTVQKTLNMLQIECTSIGHGNQLAIAAELNNFKLYDESSTFILKNYAR
jgi:hypothetical protein